MAVEKDLLDQFLAGRDPKQLIAKLKTLFRKVEARTVNALWKTVGTLIPKFSQKECANYFRNSGYAST